LLEKLNVSVACSMFLTGANFAFNFIILLHWSDPCKHFMIGYQFLEDCKVLNVTATVQVPLKYNLILGIKLVVLVTNYFLFDMGVKLATFVIGGLQSLCTSALNEHLNT